MAVWKERSNLPEKFRNLLNKMERDEVFIIKNWYLWQYDPVSSELTLKRQEATQTIRLYENELRYGLHWSQIDYSEGK